MLYFNIKRRLLYVGFGAAAFLIAYSVGAAIKMSDEEAEDLQQQFMEQIGDIDEVGIFLNNVQIALAMFIPAAGLGLGIFSGFSTGMVFAALAQLSPQLTGIPPLIILITPFGIMEVFAYGLAMSRSGLLVYHFVKKRPWREYAMPTLIEIGIVVAILLAAAVIEWQLIEQFGGLDAITIIPEGA